MALPPFDAGAVKEIVACPLPAVAVPIVGAPGVVTVMLDTVTVTFVDWPTLFAAS